GGNLLADLTDTVKQSGLDQKLYPAAMAGTTMSGKVWGLTDALRFGMWFYNPTAFKELNLQIPSTYTDLVGISKTIRNAGKYPILWGLKDLSMATNVLQVIIPQVVGTSAILKASAAKNYNVPELVPVLDMFRKMVDDKILDQSDTGITGQDARAMLGKGDSLMYPSASYDIGNIIILKAGIDAFKEPVLLVDKPVVKYWGGIGQCYCIAKASKQFDATAKFLLWWFQPEQLKVQIEKSGLVSSEPEANTAITDPLSKFAVANLDKVPEDGLFWNNYVPTAESQAWGKAVQAVVNKQRTPQQALQDIQAVFNK
ncbi:MAG TPA: extracellular solute-binding protein, partial [Chloroflexota bacterium]|nr:extracellular solute-binding protein [Chloroflexota bacterium]